MGWEYSGVANGWNGYLGGVGTRGVYWSSTSNSVDFSKDLILESNGLLEANNIFGYRYFGLSIRYIASTILFCFETQSMILRYGK